MIDLFVSDPDDFEIGNLSNFGESVLYNIEPIIRWCEQVQDILWEAYCEAEMPFGSTRDGMWHWLEMLSKEEEEGK